MTHIIQNREIQTGQPVIGDSVFKDPEVKPSFCVVPVVCLSHFQSSTAVVGRQPQIAKKISGRSFTLYGNFFRFLQIRPENQGKNGRQNSRNRCRSGRKPEENSGKREQKGGNRRTLGEDPENVSPGTAAAQDQNRQPLQIRRRSGNQAEPARPENQKKTGISTAIL